MKKLGIFLAVSGGLLQNAYAQTDSNLKLSDNFPSAGEKITLTYNPAGARLEGKNNIKATVYFINDTGFSEDTLVFKLKGKVIETPIQIPLEAKAFFFKIDKPKSVDAGKETEIDDNDRQGYVFLVYKNQHPIQGAYLAASSVYSRIGSVLAKINSSKIESNTMFQKEFELYPDSKEKYKTNPWCIIRLS